MGEFMIPIHVREEQDLYSAYDPSGLSFSSDLKEYLSDCVEDRKPGESVCLEIQSDADLDIERLRKTFLLFIEKLSRRNRREMVRSRVKSIRLLGIGVLFIVIGIISANHINSVIAAIISTIGSFSVWEASAQWIEVILALRKRDRILNKLAEAELRMVRGEASETR